MRDSLHTLFKLLLMIAIPLAAFATGLRAREPLWLLKRPWLLLRSLLAVLVVVPVVAVLLLQALHPTLAVSAGIVIAILSVGIGPPAALKQSGTADALVAYEIGLDVALLLLAIVYVPAAVALYSAMIHHSVTLDPWQVAQLVLSKMLIPLGLGMLFARLVPQRAPAVARLAGRFVLVALLIVLVLALIVVWRELIGLGVATWLTCALVAASAIVIGHLLGGSERATRTELAMFSAMRFPALALLIVAAIPRGKELLPVVLAYVITSLVLVAAYRALSARRSRHTAIA